MAIERKKKFRIHLFAVVLFLLSGTLLSSPLNSGAQYPDFEKKFSKGLLEKLNSLKADEKVGVIITLRKPAGKFGAQASRSSVRKDILSGGGKVKREYSIFEGMAAEISASKIKALASNPNVELIVEDRQFKAFLTESVPLINADDVWNKTYAGTKITGIGQTVCVIDSGVDYTHPDLGGEKGPGFKVLGGHDFVNDDNDPIDDNGHGTHVAGIIAANGTLKGVAPDANIIAIKALDEFGLGFERDILAGIDWCVSNASDYNITVISMSLGSGSYTSYCDNTETLFRDFINTAVANN
ncbi:MAG: S8 family serine peptidase, partial [Candidatus Hydrothermarchaeaceae archaeon]